VHLWETPPLFGLVVASSAESWGIMPTTVPSVECKLHRRVMDRGLGSHLLRFALGILRLKAIGPNRTMCVVR
jgi:hypothetical protein